MGRTSAHWKVYALLSRHNSEQDEIDDALWIQLTDELRAVCAKREYSSIVVDYNGDQRDVQW